MSAPGSVPLVTPLPPVFPFAWAVAYGEDQYGLWQAFEVRGVRQRMRWMPPGRFVMGSPGSEQDRLENESQRAVVIARGLWLADTAVSQELWLAVLGGKNPSNFTHDLRCPVEQVSWDDVQRRFLPALNTAVPGLDVRLPSEAEWEYGCREAGRATRAFSCGDYLSSRRANFDGRVRRHGSAEWGDFRGTTVPVDNFEPNAAGLWNMHGNVWEWCVDVYVADLSAERMTRKDPQVASAGAARAERVLRGGSWILDARHCRSAARDRRQPDYRFRNIGFRLARGPS